MYNPRKITCPGAAFPRLCTAVRALLFFLIVSGSLQAQVLDRIGRQIERKAVDRANRKIDRTIDKGLDKVEEALDESVKGNRSEGTAGSAKEESGSVKSQETSRQEQAGGVQETGSDKPADEISPAAAKEPSFAVYGKYDFVPGEKLIVFEDFSQDQVGDFPSKWNTNASGEIVNIAGSDAKWLAFTSSGALIPEFINQLPENFTIEFDLAVTPDYSYYDQPLTVSMVHLKSQKDFAQWQRFGRDRQAGVLFGFHPQDAGSQAAGLMSVEVWDEGKPVMENSKQQFTSFSKVNNRVKVAIWRQKQRVRLYVNEAKVWDLPRAFINDIAYNSLVFSRADAKEGNQFFISNLRLAVGAPDTRHKLIDEGRFATTGIYFNSGSATIRPESYGVLKEIATVLKENPAVRVNVIGHTDNDGGAELNLKLSRDRARSVKETLQKEFGIDASRLESDGKGAAEPVGDNTTSEGKAANRRVEFIKVG